MQHTKKGVVLHRKARLTGSGGEEDDIGESDVGDGGEIVFVLIRQPL